MVLLTFLQIYKDNNQIIKFKNNIFKIEEIKSQSHKMKAKRKTLWTFVHSHNILRTRERRRALF